MTVTEFLAGLESRPGLRGRVLHEWREPGRPRLLADMPGDVAEALRARLAEGGIERLYSHQAEALSAAREGRNVLVVTGTASGKSLCYNLPVLSSLLARPTERALYLFPTKALAHDQLRKLHGLVPDGPLRFAAYDGDTPVSERSGVRRHAHIIASNPDMLHVGVLPNHRAWAEYLRHLRFIVLDEVHTYTGIFGSHAAHVFRRLRRLCDYYGATPQWIGCSATVANPLEHAQALCGLPFAVIDRDGSPAGEKRHVIWARQGGASGTAEDLADADADDGEPGPSQAAAHGTFREAARLVTALVSEGIRTIAFVQSRRSAEVLLLRTRGMLAARCPERMHTLLAYRGGYLPEERRDIERRLVRGDLLGVYATTALELGVDIGGLEACVIVGYPGTIAGFRQQAGRVGRGHEPSAVFLVALEGTLDQYLARHPEYLAAQSAERATADPSNRFIQGSHLLCAAAEQALDERELSTYWPSPEGALELLGLLEEAGYVERRDRWYAAAGLDPAAQVSLRSSLGATYRIVEGPGENLIGTVDAATALYHLHPKAVYLHLGEKYRVTRCDLDRHVAHVERTDERGLTRPRVSFETRVDEEHTRRPLGLGTLHFAEMTMTSRVVGYWQGAEGGREPPTPFDLELPPQQMETVGVVVSFGAVADGSTLGAWAAAMGCDALGSLHALEHALIAVLPLLTSSGPHDVAGYSVLLEPQTGAPSLTLCDNHPGGVGITEAAYERFEELLVLTRQAVAECPCEDGCPGCVQAPNCGSNNQPLDKRGALALIDLLLDEPDAGAVAEGTE